MRNSVVAVILVIAIICAGVVGYFGGVSSQQKATSISNVTHTATVYERTSTYSSTVSSSGLELQITLSSTSIQYGGALVAHVILLNTLPANLSLTPRHSVLNSWEANNFLCGNSPDWGDNWALDGFAVFSGHYSIANLSSAGSPLTLAPPVAIPCITNPSPSIVVMLPESDVAVAQYNLSSLPPEVTHTYIDAATLSCGPNGHGATTCGDLNGALFGYWDSSAPLLPNVSDGNTSSPYFHHFPPGPYTLVAEDQWNLTAFAYFQVTAPSYPPCSGYPPGGNCLATYSYTFTLSVNYTGPWRVSYQGYNSLGRSNPTSVSGNLSGSGFYSRAITLSGLNNAGLTLCAQAQKLDGSDSTLVLTITGYNETSAPYGSVSYCGGVVP